MNNTIHVTKVQQSRVGSVDFSNIPFGKIFSDHMFVADFRDGEWHDFRIIPFGPFTMHPGMMAVHYGQSVFEGMKASKHTNGTPMLFRPEMHAKRINRSAERLMMPHFPEDMFVEALQQLVELDAAWIPPQEGSALYIRPFIFATDEFIGVRPSDTYRFCIITCPVGPYYSRPVRLRVESEYVRAVPGGTGESKAAGNYAASLLPAKQAQLAGFDQVIWMGGPEMKHIQEVGTMNIFFVINGTVVTPETDGAILHGITRDSFLHILKEKNIPLEVRPLTIDEVVEAYRNGQLDEVFGAGTAAVVSHVAEIQYGDLTMTLPLMEDRKVGPMLKDYIDGLRSGRVEDTHGWIVPVGESVEA